jgi:uncharacterized protein
LVCDGNVGHDKQTRALLSALALEPSDHTSPADLIISCGRRAAQAARARWRDTDRRALWVQILNAGFGERDLLITPEHDRLTGPDVLVSRGALVHLDTTEAHANAQQFLASTAAAQAPFAALLLARVDDFRPVAQAIDDFAARGFFLLVSSSRRSNAALESALDHALRSVAHARYAGSGVNPYPGWLTLAQDIAVSNDSINLLSEAAATNARLQVLPTSAVKLKLLDALASWRATGRLVGANESPRITPLNDTPFIAAEVARRLSLRMRGITPTLA